MSSFDGSLIGVDLTPHTPNLAVSGLAPTGV